MGVPRPHDLADGNIHLARITYFGDLQPQYLNKLVASDSLIPYLMDNGEQKRVGTLVVFMDDGIESDTPVLALPINLSLLLHMPIDKAVKLSLSLFIGLLIHVAVRRVHELDRSVF